ncbi:MAG: cysteine--tRNA ligase [Verrucomicrobiae bacterium]|nr:cysteine--tRNA ligase [Verrucomicrobiae bacterium]
MGLRLFNTLTRTVEEFVPLDPEKHRVGMYCCGPTVYDFGHIGNFRTFVLADLVRRTLEFLGYSVKHVMNITDVDDKIIRRVRQTGIPLPEYTARYLNAFLEDSKSLNLLPPHHMPRATEHIQEIQTIIKRLLERGIAYQSPDGSIYFSIDRYMAAGCRYGRLINLNLDPSQAYSRVDADEYAKESVADFALWKARVPEDGDVFWPSPWGEGRPGWHIECSAMSIRYLGPSFDLHLGGEDLIFPHHENEIAQSEGAGLQDLGTPFVRYWVHGAHLLVDGRKMSKSLGNYFTLRDLLQRGFTGREIRYQLLGSHYREPLNFTLEGLVAARNALSRIDECLSKLQEIAGNTTGIPESDTIRKFAAALEDDLNISAAWAVVFDWIRDQNRKLAAGVLMPASAASSLATWDKMDSVLGLGRPMANQAPAEIMALVEARQQARKNKDFSRADAIRDELRHRGWLVEDTPKGPRLKRILE